ncbi:MAG: uroporphyrinogen-III synthase [Campylobacterales bacterium]|nr:uroporphyrinogen-III synthase [Campylobacterales bacterium]
MIEFQTSAKKLNLEGRDTLIFTSKQAVKTAFALNPDIIYYPALSIGKATTKTLNSLGFNVLHSSQEFYGEKLAHDIQKDFFDKKLLYLRPQKVSSDIKKLLQESLIDIEEQVIYQTKCKLYEPSDKPPKDSIIIFTSPSTIHCFLENFSWDDSYIAVVIGEATRRHLPKEAHYRVASKPLIEACVQKAVEI